MAESINWRTCAVMTEVALHGQSLEDAGFPDRWTYDPLLCIWRKPGLHVVTNGRRQTVDFVLSAETLCRLGAAGGGE